MTIPRWRAAWAWPRAIAPALIVAAVILIYGQTIRHGFVNFDDPVYITDNPHVLRGLTGEGMLWAFSTGLTGMWHPLTWLSLMTNIECLGPGAAGFHAVNIALHAGCAVLLYTILAAATGAVGRSWFAALLFAIHPLNVESVAWASQRKSTLSAFFFLITILAWLRYIRGGSRVAYGIALAVFALGLLAKPMLVSLPFILILLEVWPMAGRPCGWKGKAAELAPFFFLSAVFGWICLFPFGPTDVAKRASLFVTADIMNTPLNIVTYLGRLMWPVDLAVLYPHRTDWSGMACALSLGGLLGITWIVWRLRRPVLLVGWAWFLITLAPVSGIIPLGPHATADRYVYLPAIGLFAALAWTVPWRSLWFLPYGSMVAAYCALAFAQVGLWSNSVTLWIHAAAVAPSNLTEVINLGEALNECGRYAKAVDVLLQAGKLAPDQYRVWLNLSYAYDRQGDKQGALAALQEAARRAPQDARIHNNLGSVLQDLGRMPEAEAALREAIRLRPDYAEPWLNLGVLFASRGDPAAAVKSFERALQIQPFIEGARQNLALARAELAARGK